MFIRRSTSLVIAVLCACSFALPVLSADDDDAPAKPTRVLEGGVKGSVLLFDEGIAKVSLASQLIQESTKKIIKESTRKDTVVVRGPNYIGNGIVVPAVGGDGSGIIQMGEMPIRKDRLDKYMAETEQNIAVLQNTMDALQIPADKASTVDPMFAGMRDTMSGVQDELTKLKDLSAAKKMNNTKIAKTALHIYDAMTKLQKQRGEILAATGGVPDVPKSEGQTKSEK